MDQKTAHVRRGHRLLGVALGGAVAISACDVFPLSFIDAGPDVARDDAGTPSEEISDAGPHNDGGTHGSHDAGVAGLEPDAGHVADAGTACVVDMPASPWPCEDDADFCDGTNDIDRGASTDIVQAWSVIESETFVLQVRFAAAVFTGESTHFVSVAIRESDHALDTQTTCGNSPEVIESSLALELRRLLEYLPSELQLVRSNAAAEDCCDFLDVCSHVFVSTDRQTLELRIPLSVNTVSGYWVATRDVPLCDEPDAYAAATLVPSRGGRQDEATFASICSLSCPVQ